MLHFTLSLTHNKKKYTLYCTLVQGENLDDLIIQSKGGSEIRVRFSGIVFPHTVLSKKLSYKITHGQVKDLQLLDSFIWQAVAFIREEYGGRGEKWVHVKNMP